MRLSKHFREKWRDVFQEEPDPELVRAILEDPKVVWVQQCKDMQYPNGKAYRTLRTCINFDYRLAVKLDEITGKAVTFVTG